MNGSRRLFGVILAAAGALLAVAVALLIGAVLDLPDVVDVALILLGLIGGAWYGWRLAAGLKLRQSRPGSGHGSDNR